jgi:hypothetical protein
MSRKIDIELTSDRGDGTWTWRAAGAKQPKGVVAADLLPAGSSTGQVLRAEVEVSLDGTEVVSVTPPKEKNRREVETLELISRPVKDDELVTSKLAGKGRRDRDGDRPRGRGRDGEGRGRDGRGRDGRGREGDRGGRPPREGDQRGRGERRGPREGGDARPRTDRPRRERPAEPPKPKPKRLRAGRTHRKAALDALGAAERVIAEQVLMGGLPAVRQAVEKQNEHARASGEREVAAAPLLAIAERLLPDLRSAEWLDKAEAALADIEELDLRDLRSVVVAAETGAKDDASRELATQLREGLARRVEAEQAAWLAELTQTLEEGRVVRALRLSSRPPKAGAPLPAEIATRLAEAASAALTADTFADRWATVLDALSYSPVRATVTPASKPDAPSEELVATITRFADRVPQVAAAFGIEAAPAGRRRGARGGQRRGGAKGGTTPPPRPPKPEAPAADASTEAPAEPTTEPTVESPVEATTPEAERSEAPTADAAASDAPAPAADDADAVPAPDADTEVAEVQAEAAPAAPETEAAAPATEPEPDAAAPEPVSPEAPSEPEPEPAVVDAEASEAEASEAP